MNLTDHDIAVMSYFDGYRELEKAVEELQMEWTAKNPVQGERSTKVLAYRAILGALPKIREAIRENAICSVHQTLLERAQPKYLIIDGQVRHAPGHSPDDLRKKAEDMVNLILPEVTA